MRQARKAETLPVGFRRRLFGLLRFWLRGYGRGRIARWRLLERLRLRRINGRLLKRLRRTRLGRLRLDRQIERDLHRLRAGIGRRDAICLRRHRQRQNEQRQRAGESGGVARDIEPVHRRSGPHYCGLVTMEALATFADLSASRTETRL